MRNIYRSLLLVLAGATQKELIRQNRYLKIGNQALRKKLPNRLQMLAESSGWGALLRHYLRKTG